MINKKNLSLFIILCVASVGTVFSSCYPPDECFKCPRPKPKCLKAEDISKIKVMFKIEKTGTKNENPEISEKWGFVIERCLEYVRFCKDNKDKDILFDKLGNLLSFVYCFLGNNYYWTDSYSPIFGLIKVDFNDYNLKQNKSLSQKNFDIENVSPADVVEGYVVFEVERDENCNLEQWKKIVSVVTIFWKAFNFSCEKEKEQIAKSSIDIMKIIQEISDKQDGIKTSFKVGFDMLGSISFNVS